MWRVGALMLLLGLVGCSGTSHTTTTPSPSPVPLATTTITPASTATSVASSLGLAVDGVVRADLAKRDAGAGNAWLLVTTTVRNPGDKPVQVYERQFSLAVDGRAVAPDNAAAGDAASQGDAKAGEAETRLVVFKVPASGATTFALALRKDRATEALAPTVEVSPQAGAALVAPAPTPTPMKAPTSTPTSRPPTATAAPVSPTATSAPPLPPTATVPPTAPPHRRRGAAGGPRPRGPLARRDSPSRGTRVQ